MLYIRSFREGLPLFRALGSETRVAILELLADKGAMRMTAIAEALDITGGALTSHVKALNEAGLIVIEMTGGKHGLQKLCHLNDERIVVDPAGREKTVAAMEQEIELGSFEAADVAAPCGLAGADGVIEPAGSPQAFASPQRANAGILWFSNGWIEYAVKYATKSGEKITQIEIELEMASHAVRGKGSEPCEIRFFLNKKDLGAWKSPPGLGHARTRNNPVWWRRDANQRGVLKVLTVNEEGSFLDGRQLSSVTVSQLGTLPKGGIPLRIQCGQGEDGQGGIVLFGRSFGNYRQGIKVRLATGKPAKK